MGRRPDHGDLEAFDELVYSREPTIDPNQEIDWGDLAMGFLIGRGVDPGYFAPDGHAQSYNLLCAMVCGDWEAALQYIATDEETK